MNGRWASWQIFFCQIYTTKVRRGVEDTNYWVTTKSKFFDVKSYHGVPHVGMRFLFLGRVFGRLKSLPK